MAKNYDVVIVGGNTPALVTACYLAKDAGQKVAILERSNWIGGTAMTVEMYPGYQFSPAATGEFYVHPKVNFDLQLTTKYGLVEIESNPTLTTAFGNGEYLSLYPDVEKTCAEIAKYSQHDADAYRGFIKDWLAVGTMFGLEQMNEPPSMGQFVSAMSSSPAMERMCRDMLFGTPKDILDNVFEDDHTKAAFMTLMEGATSGPRTAAFFFNLGRILHPWGFIKGGLKEVARALEDCATDLGVDIIRNANVEEILTKDGEAYGCRTTDGEIYNAAVAVVSELEVPNTYNNLVKGEEYPEDFVRGVKEIKYECGGVTLNLALDYLPDFGFPEECYNGWFGVTTPGLRYTEEAYAKYNLDEMPDKCLSMTYIPSYYEEPGSFAPEGHHVLTGYAFPFPGEVEGGWTPENKQKMIDIWIDSLEEFCPGLREHVIYADGYSPKELEDMFGMTNGDLGHGTLRWYSEFSYRPMPGYSKYRGPIKNLYMGGQNVHPLSGVGGVAGMVISNAIIKDHDLKKTGEGSNNAQFQDRW